MKRLFDKLKEYKGVLTLALVLAAINQGFSLLDPQIFRLIIDKYATRVDDYTTSEFVSGVLVLLLASVGVALVSRIAKNLQDYYVNSLSHKIGFKLYSDSLSHASTLPYGMFEDHRSGELLLKLQKAKSDSEKIIATTISVVFFSMVGILFVLTYAFFVHPLIGTLYFLIIPILGSFTFFTTRKIKEIQKAIVIETAELAGSTTETLRNVELVKSLGLEKQEIDRLNAVNDRILDLELKKIKTVRQLSFMQGTAINAMRSLLLFVMLWFIFKGTISVGEFFSLFIYSFFIFSPLGEFGNFSTQFQETKASLGELDKIIDLPSEEKPIHPKEIKNINSISFKDTIYTYESSHAGIKGVSFSIKKGISAAFVGPSGSGKTTIIKLILGLYKPISGHILYNDVTEKEIDYEALRKKVGFVAQETQLFAGTIKENLLFVKPDATDEECMIALTRASIDHIVSRNSLGLNTKIGEGGIKISGGERQRLAIARALLRQPEILIFDEATSSLDSMTEKHITETIKSLREHYPDMIMISVAHRLSTILHSDRIFVLEKGIIAEEGQHHDLVARKGLYYALWREQSGEES